LGNPDQVPQGREAGVIPRGAEAARVGAGDEAFGQGIEKWIRVRVFRNELVLYIFIKPAKKMSLSEKKDDIS